MQLCPIISVEGLVKEYPIKSTKLFSSNKIRVVNDVSFDVLKGRTLGIVGESGCGKSTVARMIMRLIPVSKGKIFFRGEDFSEYSERKNKKLRDHIQMIFQDPYASLDPRKRILDSIIEPLEIHRIGTPEERKKRAYELLKKVGLDNKYAKRFPHELSGGQCQRINIARALMLNPDVIICDEPVSALDVSIQAQIINLLLDLQEQFGITYIFISHDLGVVRYFCDDVVVMNLGNIVERGTAEAVYESPKAEYTKKLLSAIPGKNLM